MRDNRAMRYGRVLILAAAVMAAGLLAVSCSSEPAPLVVSTATQGPAATSVPPTEPPPPPTVVPTVEVVEEPEDLVLPVISEKQYELIGTQEWINSDPLTLEGLADEGKVVLVDFWTYT